jgi:hypothetical protein
MRLAPATEFDVGMVLIRPSVQTKLDLESVGFDRQEAYALLTEWLDGAVTLWIDDAPAAVFGLVDETADVWMTWFIATQPYFDGGLPVLRFSRRYLADRFKGHTVKTMSRNTRPEARKWFKLMGYEVESEKDGETLYAYKHH